MTSLLRALLVCSPLLLAACTTQVIGGALTSGGGGSGGGSSVSTNSGGTNSGGTNSGGSDGSGGTLESPPNAIAMTRAQTDAAWDIYWQTHGGDTGSSSSSGGGDLDPNDLFLRFTDLGEACSLPMTDLPCGGHWEVRLVLPPSLQQVGVYDLSDPLLVQYSSASETGTESSSPSGECSWGGGSLGEGSLEIVSIGATQVHFRVTLTSGLWQNVQGGEYVAERCP